MTTPARRIGWRDFSKVYGAKLAGVVLGVILGVASARILAPAGRGEFASLSAAVVISVQVLNLGLSSSFVVLFSRNPSRIRPALPWMWGLAPALGLAFTAGLVGVGAITRLGVPRGTAGVLAALWVVFQLLGIFQGSALTAARQVEGIAILEFGGKAAATALGLASLYVGHGNVLPFVAAIVTADGLIAVGGALLLVRAIPRGEGKRPGPFFGEALRIGVRAYPVLLLPYLLVKSDILLVRYFRGAAEAGVYSIVSQLVDVGIILPATIASLVLPDVVRDFGSGQVVARLLRPLVGLLAAIVAVAALAGSPAIRLLYGEAYAGAYGALLLVLPGLVAFSLLSVLSQHFAAAGFPAFLSLYWLAGLSVNLGLNLLLIPRWGMRAAAATSSIGYTIVFILVARRFLSETGITLRRIVRGPA